MTATPAGPPAPVTIVVGFTSAPAKT
jgi:hypothetical protein